MSKPERTGWKLPGAEDKDGNIKEGVISAYVLGTIAVLGALGVAAIIGILFLIGTILGADGCVGENCLLDTDYTLRGDAYR